MTNLISKIVKVIYLYYLRFIFHTSNYLLIN